MPQAGGPSPSRLLLRRLRDAMAGGGTAQERLDKVVGLIAADMVAEVCSAYLLRAGEVLELFASKGLKPEAVHKTRLRLGEGLVGDIAAHARPLALSEAESHPQYAYRPETGEEIYHSFLGVPMLRGGRVLGVLVVQNRTRRHYVEEEVETLETVAMVLAELVSGGELIAGDELRPAEGIALMPIRLEGMTLSEGLAIGQAVLHEPPLRPTQIVAEDPRRELSRLHAAVAGMHRALDDLLASSELARGGEHRDILESYRLFAEDRGWLESIAEAIDGGLTAEAAIQKVTNDLQARLVQASDSYLRERLHDFEDLANRLVRHLGGGPQPAPRQPLPDSVVVAARNLGPAELLDYDRARLRGVALEEGSPNSHVAIVARALGIPILGRVQGLLTRVDAGDPVVLDADNGQLLVRPPEDVQQRYAESMQARARRQAGFEATRGLPAMSRDGVAVSLNINAGMLIDLPQLEATGADGVGLYRTELLFMVSGGYPDVRTQTDLYRKIIDHAAGRPVLFRTLDVGGDKLLPYWRGPREENPAMGWRAIRIALDRPAMLRQQLRAMLRAAAGRPLAVMFPMIAEVVEFDRARALLRLEAERAEERGLPLPRPLRVGAMFEVPALAWELPALLRRVDFLSVGSNDLAQFLFASDRGNPALSQRYDMLSPALLRLLDQLARAAAAAGVPLGLCGEMAGHPLEAMTLVGLGFRSLSMAAPAVGPVRSMTRSLEVGALRRFLDALLETERHSLRGELESFARDHKIAI